MKKVISMKISSFLFVFLLASILSGQSSEELILQKITDALTPGSNIVAYDINFEYFESLNDSKPSSTMKVNAVIGQKHYWSRFADYEFFGDGKLHCVLDHQAKTIVVTESVQKAGIPGANLSEIVSLVKGQGLELNTFDASKGLKGLLFEAPQYSRTRIEILYEPDTYYLRETIIRIDVDEPRASLEFNKCKIAGKYDNYRVITGGFPYSLKKYIIKSGDKFEPAAAFSDYQLRSF